MKHKVIISFLAAAMVTGCSTTAQKSQTARVVSYEEAFTFIRKIQNTEPSGIKRPESKLFTQPVNKTEPCKLPTEQNQIDRQNFRAYWDGACKNGYAFGLGRDIAISDTHHIEEITIHNGTGNNIESLSAIYDFVNNISIYRTATGVFPASSMAKEVYQYDGNNFFTSLELVSTDEHGNTFTWLTSPFKSEEILVKESKGVIYKFTDYSKKPVTDPVDVTFTAETLDPKTLLPGGSVVVKHANGLVRHLKISSPSNEEIQLPEKYTQQLSEELKLASNAVSGVSQNIDRAKQMEREYLYKACNGQNIISGLSTDTATKICNWRSQFKEPYDRAMAKYSSEMDALRQRAEITAKRRAAQQQAEIQATQLQQYQAQQSRQNSTNTLEQFNQQMGNFNMQMQNSLANQPISRPSFPLFQSPGNNQINCIHTGPVSNCRY